MSGDARPETVDISVVIPVHNEEDNLEPLLTELETVMRSLRKPFEVICVDDRSTDNSLAVLTEQQKRRSYLRVLRHRVNCGESAGQATGFRNARGALVVTMDADQQNDPADIPALLAALVPDVVAVCGVRRKREDDWVRRVSSRLANAFRNGMTGDRITDAGCTYRIIRRTALAELPVFNGMHRFLPTMLRYQGYRVTELLVNHRPRTRGQSKYGVGNRLWRGIKDCFGIRWYRARCVPAERMEMESDGR
jgi:glycosyltransferase involved in cell wall biosynthesis